ncbi:MAG: SLC13 family permease [Gammaproteobacteria bacterium]|nr:SLC13 family permease [Gammaproteobacteria bacterium]
MLNLAGMLFLGALLSGFMNNVGAMALLMPIAIQLADRFERPRGVVLMPLAFSTILGGMTTALIGTPPNLIVSGFRAEAGLESFGMFDFMPVGAPVMLGGVFLIAIVGWRLVPARSAADTGSFDTGTYLTEVRVRGGGRAIGMRVREAEEKLGDADAQIVGMVRNDFRIFTPQPYRVLREGDVLVIEAEPELLASALSSLGLDLESHVAEEEESEEEKSDKEKSDKEKSDKKKSEKDGDEAEDADEESEEGSERKEGSDEQVIRELVAMPDSTLIGQSADDIALRDRYGMSLLAISRQGRRTIRRLRSTKFQPGDVLLLQGSPDSLSAFTSEFRSVPWQSGRYRCRIVARRGWRRGSWSVRSRWQVSACCRQRWLSPPVSSFLPYRRSSARRDSMTRSTGPSLFCSVQCCRWRMRWRPPAPRICSRAACSSTFANGNSVIALVIVLVLTMTLSDFMNNAATAAVMCPIALSIASQLDASPDSFLMAVAIGASCAMLTPVGHQNNTLILGPGGFRFGDYWRLGLPLEIVVVSISIPLLLIVWPL